MLGNKNKGNGNRGSATPGGPMGSNTAPLKTFLDNIQQQNQNPNVLRDFVHPGKSPADLLMRTHFHCMGDLNCAVLMLFKIKEFSMDETYTELVLNKLAALPSLFGLSRKELLQAATGVVAPALYPGF